MDKSKGSKLRVCPGVDRISHLPDGIIDNILIRLPIADAARTVVLSRKWKHAWSSISELNFDCSFASKSKKAGHRNLITAIYAILMLHSGPIVGFKLSITCPKRISEIDLLFNFLSQKSIQKLDVHIFQRGKSDNSANYILPSHFYSCLKLRCLNLVHCTIKPPCNFGGFRNLNSLELGHMELTNSVFENFISKCPLLEELEIADCNFIESSIIKINSSNLKRFHFNGVGSGFRFISAPLLKSIEYIDSRSSKSGERYSNCEGVEKSSLKEFCNALPALESLKVDYYFLQTLEVRNMSGTYRRRSKKRLPRLKYLEANHICLWNMDEATSLLGLIGSSPNLNKVVMAMDRHNNQLGMDNPFRSLEVNHLSCKKLKRVTFSGIANHDPGMDFVKLLLLKSPKLKKMLIAILQRATPHGRLQILKKVNRFRRTSAAAKVIFK